MYVPIGLHGNVRVRAVNRDTGEVRDCTQGNTVTSGGLALLADYLAQADPGAAPRPPSFIAVGSGQISDTGYFLTALPNEGFRTAIVQRDREGLAVVYHAYFEPQDANGQQMGNFGLFARDATNDPTTGTLVAVVNYATPFWKTAAISFSVDWTITPSGRMGTR